MSDIGEMSRSQIEKLGERLRSGDVDEADIKLLERFKSIVMVQTDELAAKARNIAQSNSYYVQYTARQQKTNASIVAKLRRTKVELSRMQDISACRFIVPTMKHLEGIVDEVFSVFPDAKFIMKSGAGSFGYRADHIILRNGFYSYEIQARTTLQHFWAELSEKLADRFGQDLKYGSGPAAPRSFLLELSREIASLEADEIDEVMGYLGDEGYEADPVGDEGSPEHRAKKSAIIARMAEVERFL